MGMNILHVYKDYYPVLGGIENHIRALAEAQVQRGHTVTVLVTHPGRRTVEENLNGVRIIKAGRIATIASTPISLNFPRALGALQPDITHLQSPYPVGEIAQFLLGRERRYVITYQADVTRPAQRAILRMYGPLLRLILRRAARVIATSPNYAASSPYLRGLGEKLAIVPLSADVERFTPTSASTAVPLKGEPLTLLFVGQMRHYKGVDDLLRALSALPPSVRLVLAGEGPKRAEWEALSEVLGLRERVTFLGERPHESLPMLYQSADIFVLPSNSRAEALGMALVEAMACGLPCVTTEVGSGTSYVVKDEVTGIVVPPRSPPALAEALNRLIANPALRTHMGAAGRARAVQLFAFEKMVERIEDVYRAIELRRA
jgi:glycosyltransferase involved in cell wall biosynthesis